MVETGSHGVAPMTHSAYPPESVKLLVAVCGLWTPTQMLQNMFWEGLCSDAAANQLPAGTAMDSAEPTRLTSANTRCVAR